MKIAYDYQVFSWQEYGGISRYFFELANNIALSKAADVALICPMYVNSYVRSASIELHVKGKYVPVKRFTGRLHRAVNQALAPLFMQYFSPDLVHETYYSVSRGVPRRSRVVLTVFDMIHEKFPGNFTSGDATYRMKAESVKRADHIICISENTRQDLIDILGVAPEKTSMVHLGYTLTDPNIISPIVADDRPYLLYVGSRSGYKNFETLLRVFATVDRLWKNFDLVVFGGGRLSATEQDLMATLKLAPERVRHISGDDACLASLYCNAEVFVYPSLYEGFGIPPLEAMSFDCPVACSNTSSMPEVVGNAALLFDPQSIDSIGEALLLVVEDKSMRQNLIELGRERIKDFSWDKCGNQTMQIYKSLLS